MKENIPLPNEESRNPIEWMRWIPASLLAIAFVVALIIGGKVVLIPLLVSLTLAYLLAPIVKWFENRGWSRAASVLLTMTGATLILVLALIFIVPSFWSQLTTSYDHARELITNYRRAEPLLAKIKRINPQLYAIIQSQIERYTSPVEQTRIRGIVAGWLQSGLFKLANMTTSIFDLLLIPFFVFYLLADYKAMRERIDSLIPPRFRSVAAELINQINHVVSSYVRSQLAIALLMGVLYSLGFLALRVPMAITIGMLAGLLNFVPYLGTLTGIVVSLAFAALDGAGVGRLIGVVSIFAVVQSFEGYYLTPKLLGSRLDLHPLWVLIGLMIGGNLFGLLGIILAVPMIAIGKVVLGFLESLYQQSGFYRSTGVNLVTEQGRLVDFTDSTSPSHLIIDPSLPEKSRRSVITTAELKSRLKETDYPSGK